MAFTNIYTHKNNKYDTAALPSTSHPPYTSPTPTLTPHPTPSHPSPDLVPLFLYSKASIIYLAKLAQHVS